MEKPDKNELEYAFHLVRKARSIVEESESKLIGNLVAVKSKYSQALEMWYHALGLYEKNDQKHQADQVRYRIKKYTSKLRELKSNLPSPYQGSMRQTHDLDEKAIIQRASEILEEYKKGNLQERMVGYGMSPKSQEKYLAYRPIEIQNQYNQLLKNALEKLDVLVNMYRKTGQSEFIYAVRDRLRLVEDLIESMNMMLNLRKVPEESQRGAGMLYPYIPLSPNPSGAGRGRLKNPEGGVIILKEALGDDGYYCKYCGNKLTKESKNCSRCGRDLD